MFDWLLGKPEQEKKEDPYETMDRELEAEKAEWLARREALIEDLELDDSFEEVSEVYLYRLRRNYTRYGGGVWIKVLGPEHLLVKAIERPWYAFSEYQALHAVHLEYFGKYSISWICPRAKKGHKTLDLNCPKPDATPLQKEPYFDKEFVSPACHAK